MNFSDSLQSKFSETYRKSLVNKVTYFQENISSALSLAEISKEKYKKHRWEKYAIGQAEMLNYTVEILMDSIVVIQDHIGQ